MGLINKNIVKKKKKSVNINREGSPKSSFFTVVSLEDLAKLRNTAYSFIR